MRLIFIILFILLSLFSLEFILYNYTMNNAVSLFTIAFLFFVTLIFTVSGFNINYFLNLFKTNFIVNPMLLLISIIGITGIVIIGYSASGIYLKLSPDNSKDLEDFSLFILLFSFINVFFEEILFRSFLITELVKKNKPTKAVFISASIFAIGHLGNGVSGILILFFLGAILGYVYWLSKSWFLCFLIHLGYNYSLIFIDQRIIHGAKILFQPMSFYFMSLLVGVLMLFYSFRVLRKKVKLTNAFYTKIS